MLIRLRLRNLRGSKCFYCVSQERPSFSDMKMSKKPGNSFSKKGNIDEHKVMNTPSTYVADKSLSLFEKYKTDPKDETALVDLTLAKKTQLTHDSYVFKLDFPEGNENMVMGTDIARVIRFCKVLPTKEDPQGTMVMRYYTVSSPVDMKGSVEVPIKVYRANEDPKYPDGGIMTSYLDKMKIGQRIKVLGPIERLQYYGNGLVRTGEKGPYDIVKKNHMIFVAAGSGITPYYRILKDALEHNDPTKFTLIYSNKTEDDIMFEKELEELALLYPHKFTYKKAITYPINFEELEEDTHIGKLTPEYLLEHLPEPSEDILVTNMGPNNFNKFFAEFIVKHTSYDPITQIFSRDVDSLIF
ncbi:unnamed protein product [Moneuplotes crassus]|uniref:NADH-cytochrome b5 reductase n=1 Tax=Euplotes crassus TaxID=5936 RepID=A0AAD1UMQ9_EUPCR|nr:unnamed protein product [Moneuplotes crassus]